MKRSMIIWLTGSMVFIAGIWTCLANNGGGTGAAPDKGAEIAGAIMILAPLTAVVIAGLRVVAAEARRACDAHRAWLASLPPGQRDAVIQAERAAALAATAVAAIALHERHVRTDARLSETAVWGHGNPGHLTSAQRHPLQPPVTWGNDPSAASQEMLGRSQAIWESFGGHR